MSKRILVATYESEDGLLAGARAARQAGLTILDAYTPYAVHGLDKAMGLKPSRLTWVCFAFGALGVIFITWFQFWTSAVSWPVNIGGKPWNSLPAFAPAIFEMMVLFAGLGTVIVLFAISRLWPGKRSSTIVPGTTDDRFALVVEHETAAMDLEEVRATFETSHPLAIEDRVLELNESRAPLNDDLTRAPRSQTWLGAVNWTLAAFLLFLAITVVFGVRNPTRPNWEVFREMFRSPASSALSSSSVLPDGITFQAPVPHTIPQGLLPLHYEATDASAALAGQELENPYKPNEQGLILPAIIARGRSVFTKYCACCHGPTGAGDGPVSRRGFPPPTSYAVGKSNEMKDGQIFHMLTYGKGNMPSHAAQVPRGDRWKVILYVRQLQANAKAELAKAEAAAEAEKQAAAKKANASKADTEKAGATEEKQTSGTSDNDKTSGKPSGNATESKATTTETESKSSESKPLKLDGPQTNKKTSSDDTSGLSGNSGDRKS